MTIQRNKLYDRLEFGKFEEVTALKEMKHDSSTIAWSAMGDEWFELAQTG